MLTRVVNTDCSIRVVTQRQPDLHYLLHLTPLELCCGLEMERWVWLDTVFLLDIFYQGSIFAFYFDQVSGKLQRSKRYFVTITIKF